MKEGVKEHWFQDQLDVASWYELLVHAVSPRPVALVTTENADGSPNVAPYSFFTVVGVNPPVLALGPSANADGEDKTTLVNLERTGEFVVNVVEREMLPEFANLGSGQASIDRFEASLNVKAQRLGSSPIQFECKTRDVLRYGEGPFATILVVGEVVCAHAFPSFREVRPVARLGGPEYLDSRGPEIFTI